jgi:LysR family glycine cleavage system transcriptional activator
VKPATEKIFESLRKSKNTRSGELPLNALRAFEAAARHLSLTKAAAELNVTPGAIGHQINNLQERLNVKLFHRVGNKLELTAAGETALPMISSAFTTLCLAVDSMTPERQQASVKIAVDITFASMWLAPKLASFSLREPEIDVWVVPPIESLLQIPGEVDLAIRYSADCGEGLNVTHLHDETMSPVCSPAYLAKSAPIENPGDLKKHALLTVETSLGTGAYPSWSDWGEEFGVSEIDDRANLHFAHSILAIEAALADQGVALVSLSNVGRYLKNGDLVLPFADRFCLNLSRYVLAPSNAINKASMRLLEWLKETDCS